MAKKLTAAFVRTVRQPGKYGDQHGLILRVLPSGSKQWIWRGTIRGKRVDLGLGGYPYTTLAEARQEAFEHRKLSRAGGDPRQRRSRAPTFAQAVEKVVAIHRAQWRPGSRSERQWRASLKTHAMPQLAERGVDEITTADVMAVLIPIWHTKSVTARRVRQRIGAVMKWAMAQGFREDNPAGDAISAALPKIRSRPNHHRALPHAEVAAALEKVRESDVWQGIKLALEFLVLTAARSGEVRGARWEEADLSSATWTIPADRIKAGREHRIPLSGRALEILAEVDKLRDGSGLIFTTVRGRAVRQEAFSRLLHDLAVPAVPHGFRTSFRTWCGDVGVAREVAEAALAHVIKGKAEAAYARGDLLGRRREVMEAWSQYVAQDENGG